MSHPDLSYEQARNKEYLEKLEKKLAPNYELAGHRNVIWADGTSHLQQMTGVLHPLIGRVGLDSDDEDLGHSFYIGPWRLDQDGICVISWAAPAARDIWFQPAPEASRIAAKTVVRRTFSPRLNEIEDLDDEIVRDSDAQPFAAPGIAVPPPAAGHSRRRAASPAPEPARPEPASQQPESPQEGTKADNAGPLRPAGGPAHPGTPEVGLRKGMRAADAVLKRLAAPRSDQLASVLPTLQPDQHRLVCWPHDEPLIVQGHPGTGKTVVATYRAAYLANPALYEDDGPLAGQRGLRILLVGPTAAYVHHVSQIIQLLDHDALITVTHLAQLLADMTGIRTRWGGSFGGGGYIDVDSKARGFADQAVRIARARSQLRYGKGSAQANIKTVYDLIRSNGASQMRITSDPAVMSWMHTLPEFSTARGTRRYLPLLAQCRVAFQQIPDSDKYDHIIVDESQDVSPIEWNILNCYLARGGQWTLVGDMNQRRSDTGYGSWQEIADHLILGDGNTAFGVQTMQRGYRSTDQILRFADRLLPANNRRSRSIQADGPPVIRDHVPSAAQIIPRATELARDLSARYRHGTTAIITIDPAAITRQLASAGWRKERSNDALWSRDDLHLRVHHPESARGLEFDAVIVVEPGTFPKNVGRDGQLYTSLTRANRELAVVWHASLPDGLRKAARG